MYDSAEFKALVLANELNLSKIGQHFGIARKFKWEDALILKENQLKGIISEPTDQQVYIFHFGSMVFVNFEKHQIMDFVHYLHNIEKSIDVQAPFTYYDDFKLEINPDIEPSITNEGLITPSPQDFQREIIALVLAKSVSLDKIELKLDLISDQIEEPISLLQRGSLSMNDKRLSIAVGNILGVKHHSMSYLMLLDKPDITWANEEASHLFDEMSAMFELDDRYNNIQHKTSAMMNIIEVFASLAHAKRGTRLEWMVIILIAVEILLTLFELFVLK